jgi:hypothetical protein
MLSQTACELLEKDVAASDCAVRSRFDFQAYQDYKLYFHLTYRPLYKIHFPLEAPLLTALNM